jgi:phage terminase large subunit
MTEVEIRLPEKLIPVFQGRADVRGAYGGRGSAKTRSFAKMAAFFGMRFGQAGVTGQILCARQYMNSLDDSSLEEVKRAIEDEPALAAYYEVGEKYVRSRDRKVWFSFAGLDRSIDSIKSKGRILLCWVDEAEPVTDNAWMILIPTLREEGADWNAELWVTWNPKRKTAPVEKRFRKSKDPLVKVVELNYLDNPKFPKKLERERQRDLAENPDQYPHVWDGAYRTVVEGAYYAKHLAVAKAQGRIGRVGADPLMTYRAIWDIGGTGAKADAVSIWIAQFVGKEIRVLNHYAAQGQELGEHVKWLRDNGYEKALCVLPHDGAQNDKVFRVSYESALNAAGFATEVVPNMGQGAASIRIEAARRVFPNVWFNNAPDKDREDVTEAGREALGSYHEKKHPETGVGLGPNHDWASHDADSFGLLAVHYEQRPQAASDAPIPYKRLHVR